MEEFCEKEPPTSTRTSNPHCDRLDFENDDGGSNAADQSFELSDAQDSDSEGDLEEGEIQSEADTNEEDSKFLCGVKGNRDSDINKKPHIPNFNIVKYKQSDENDSPASSSMLDSSTDQFKTESSDMAPDSYIKSDMESSDGEIYSASEDNQISEDREQSVDLYDMVFDFKSEKDQSTADSLDDTLTEDVSESVGKKRKHTDIENDHSKSQNNEGGPVAKKSKGDQATVGGNSSDGGNLLENGLTHEFDVIDETNEEGGDNYDQDVGDYDSDEDDLDDNEIYAWLEEGVNKKSVKLDDGEEGPSQREKLVLQGTVPIDIYFVHICLIRVVTFASIPWSYLTIVSREHYSVCIVICVLLQKRGVTPLTCCLKAGCWSHITVVCRCIFTSNPGLSHFPNHTL